MPVVVLEPFFHVSPDKEPRKVDPAKTTVGPCWIMKTKAEVTGWGLNKAKSIKHPKYEESAQVWSQSLLTLSGIALFILTEC